MILYNKKLIIHQIAPKNYENSQRHNICPYITIKKVLIISL
jgi:hypothetical protein